MSEWVNTFGSQGFEDEPTIAAVKAKIADAHRRVGEKANDPVGFIAYEVGRLDALNEVLAMLAGLASRR